MTLAVGLMLVGIFVVFATLMSLERLSALLALPLMAVVFVLVALAADLLQPPTTTVLVTTQSTDAFGRRITSSTTEEQPSRFAGFRAALGLHATLLHERATLMLTLADELAAGARAGPAALQDALRAARAARTAFEARCDERRAAAPPFAVQDRKYAARARDLGAAEYVQALATVSETHTGAVLVARTDRALETLRRAARPDAAAPRPPGPFRAAVLYLEEYLVHVLGGGALRLSGTIIATLFGGMFAMYVKHLKIAERLIYWTAEFAGERPFIIGLAVFLATMVIFTSVGGLGTVIMLGTIILPVLRSVGLSPVVAAGTFLIAIAMGGTLQPVNRRLWMDFYGVSAAQIDALILTMLALYAVLGLGWVWWGTRRGLLSSFQSEVAPPPPRDAAPLPPYLMAAPLLPVLLVYFVRLEEVTAFTAGLVFMYLCVCRQSGAVRRFARALIEGAQAVVPPVLLMLGIGILLTSLSTPPVQQNLQPLLAAAVPQSRWGYIALFAIGAPLALYRGPLNIWGMGLAVSAILLATSGLSAPAILGAILAAGMLQGISDPTNTANVWIAGFQGITVNQILRYTLVPVWIAAAVAVAIFGLRYVGG